jgi:outer membrane biosynthesis protein TonB
VAAVIGRDGRIGSVKVVDATHPAFAREVAAVVALWQFTPVYLNCSAVETAFDVTVNFVREQ